MLRVSSADHHSLYFASLYDLFLIFPSLRKQDSLRLFIALDIRVSTNNRVVYFDLISRDVTRSFDKTVSLSSLRFFSFKKKYSSNRTVRLGEPLNRIEVSKIARHILLL